jgi:preprotein translocase subunit SecA
MDVEDVSDNIQAMTTEVVSEVFAQHIAPESLEEQWDISGLEDSITREFGLTMPVSDWLTQDDSLYEETLRDKIEAAYIVAYQAKEAKASEGAVRHLEKAVMLQVLDEHWKEHLSNMDHLRQGIGLRGYAQKDPKQEYKREAFTLFEDMLDVVKYEVVGMLSKVQLRSEEEVAEMEAQRKQQEMEFNHPQLNTESAAETAVQNAQAATPTARPAPAAKKAQPSVPKIGRNDTCPCGSGKKYKKCHGALA